MRVVVAAVRSEALANDNIEVGSRLRDRNVFRFCCRLLQEFFLSTSLHPSVCYAIGQPDKTRAFHGGIRGAYVSIIIRVYLKVTF